MPDAAKERQRCQSGPLVMFSAEQKIPLRTDGGFILLLPPNRHMPPKQTQGVSGVGMGVSFRSNEKWMMRQTTPTLIAESATLNAGQ